MIPHRKMMLVVRTCILPTLPALSISQQTALDRYSDCAIDS